VVLSETTGTNTTRYVHGPRGIHAQKDAANVWEHPLQDGLGSVRSVVDNAATILDSRNYDPYGNSFGVVGTTQTGYGFTGELLDGGGLLDLRARRYNAGLGIFASLDPFEGMMGRPMSLNGYGWVEGNTPNAVDPSGKFLGAVAPAVVPFCSVYLPVCIVGGVAAALFLVWWLNKGAPMCAEALTELKDVFAPDIVGDEDRDTVDDEDLPGPFQDWRRPPYTWPGWQPYWFPYPPANPQPQPQPQPPTSTPRPQPTPTPTPSGCNPNRVRQWMVGRGIVETRSGTAYDYQRRYAGLKYIVPTDTGETIEADGVRASDCALLETKYIGAASSSPFVLGSSARSLPFVNDLNDMNSIDYQQNDEFRRYGLALRAPDSVNPFVKLEVILSDLAATSYFQIWITQNNVPNASFRHGQWP
jgi:RHS repeat-associated protein